MQQVAAGLALLLAVGSVAACGGDDGEEAEAAAFVGTPWILSSGLDVEGWEASPPSATFDDEIVGGSSGCNRFTAPYTVDGDALEIGVVASTQMACPPPADAVERAYLDALGRVAEWRSEGEELALLDGEGGELLRYAAATPVGEWEVTAFLQGDAVSSPVLDTEITASFGSDGTLAGSAGCNTYTATYTTDRGEIEISQPASTRMFCPEPEGVMEQEAAYLAALPTAVQFRLDGGSLALLSADGTYVAAYASAAQP
jgi:heat shock protein HslJ